MTARKALLLWGLGWIAWTGLVGKTLLPHYAPLLSESRFVFIPMVQSGQLMEATDAHRDLLTRTRLTGNYWIDAFGVTGEVRIEYMVEITPGDTSRTWMPYQGSFASFPLTSPTWLAYRTQLVSQAMVLRDQEIDRVLKVHALKDALLLFGVPLIWLAVIFAIRANANLLDQPAQGGFSDF